MGLSFFNPFLTLFAGRLTPQSCHPVVPTMLFFDLVLAGPLLGLLYAFLLLNSSSPALSLGLFSCCFGLPWPISLLLGSLGPFYSFGASPAHSNPPFPWVFAKSFGLLRPKLPYLLLSGFIDFSTNPYFLNSFLGLLRPILACFPFLIMPMGLLLLSSGSFRPVCFP